MEREKLKVEIYYNNLVFETQEEFIAYFKKDLLVYPDGVSTDDDLLEYALVNEYAEVKVFWHLRCRSLVTFGIEKYRNY